MTDADDLTLETVEAVLEIADKFDCPAVLRR